MMVYIKITEIKNNNKFQRDETRNEQNIKRKKNKRNFYI